MFKEKLLDVIHWNSFCFKISGDFKYLFYKYLFGYIEIINRNLAFRLSSKIINY